MLGIVRAIDAFSDRLGRLLAWLLLAMMLLSVLVVVLRYSFGIGALALQETVLYLHATLFMLGAGYALRHNAHVRVDILNQRFPPRVRAAIEIGGTLFFLLPVCVFLGWMSLDYVAASFRVRELSTDGDLPAWLLKAALLAMPALLALQGLAEVLRNALFLAGRHPELYPETQHHEAGEL